MQLSNAKPAVEWCREQNKTPIRKTPQSQSSSYEVGTPNKDWIWYFPNAKTEQDEKQRGIDNLRAERIHSS
jgi:hypothetical protein